jgi:hypothetical protein
LSIRKHSLAASDCRTIAIHRPNKSFSSESVLPDADPGDVVAHRWRKRLFSKMEGKWHRDPDKVQRIKADSNGWSFSSRSHQARAASTAGAPKDA